MTMGNPFNTHVVGEDFLVSNSRHPSGMVRRIPPFSARALSIFTSLVFLSIKYLIPLWMVIKAFSYLSLLWFLLDAPRNFICSCNF